MANRYWVGGTGTWSSSDTSHWAASSGGSPGASVPGSSDSATFDGNSGTGTVTINYAPTIAGFFTSASALTFSGTNGMSVGGSVTLGASNTYNVTGTLTITNTCTFTSNGKSWAGGVTVNASGKSITIADDFSIGGDKTFSLLAGTVATIGHNMTMGQFVSSGSGTCTLFLSGTLTFLLIPSSSGVTSCFWITNSNFSFSPGTGSTVKLVPTYVGELDIGGSASGISFNNFWYSPSGSAAGDTLYLGNNQSFNEFKDDGASAHTIKFGPGKTYTFTTFNVNGNAGQLISLRSGTTGTRYNFSKASGTVSVDYLDIKDSAAGGGATWNAGPHSNDSGNNTGWNFASSAANIAPTLYTNDNTFYSTVVRPTVWTVAPSIYNNSNTFYTAVVHTTVNVAPTLYTNANTFYTAAVVSGIGPTLFQNTNTFYTAVIGRGAVGITPSLYTNSNTFFTATVRNVKRITPLLYTNDNTFYTAVLTIGAAHITPTLYVNTNTFYTAVLTGGIQAGHINPTLFENTNTFFTPVVLSTSKITPILYQNDNTFYVPVRTSTVNVAPARFDNTNTFFNPALTTSARAISPSLVVNTQTFYTPTLSWITKENAQSFIIGLG